jgi:hypothetical protein
VSDEVVSVKIDASRVNLKLEELPQELREAILSAVVSYGGSLVDEARSRAETLLQVKTGKFVSRIRFALSQRKNSIVGRVYSTDPRANLFEWGGRTGPHEILPDKAQALKVMLGGKNFFFAGVHHPGGNYAPRDIIHGAFDPTKSEFAASLEAAADEAVSHANGD